MNLIKDIQELIDANIITRQTGEDILDYYRGKEGNSQRRLFIVFGILGALLMGLGIILILAHNWDELPRTIKTAFAFLPLVIGQLIGGFVILKKQQSDAWRESTAVFLFFAVGACISLVSQIYHIPGNLSSFLLTWMLLCLPLIYLMRSSIASLFYISGITYYACETGYFTPNSPIVWLYWILLILALPHYYLLFRKKPASNFTVFHHWLIPISIVIVLGTLSDAKEELMFIAYFSLLACFYFIGNFSFFKRQRIRNNGYLVTGSLGTVVLLLTLSFEWFWKDLGAKSKPLGEMVCSPEFLIAAILTNIAIGLLIYRWKSKSNDIIKPIEFVFITFIVIYFIGIYSSIAILLINCMLLLIGVLTIREGARRDHLGILNYGLLIIMALITSRFFDTNLSFAIRGILFLAAGAGFFITNYRMLQKRKTNE